MQLVTVVRHSVVGAGVCVCVGGDGVVIDLIASVGAVARVGVVAGVSGVTGITGDGVADGVVVGVCVVSVSKKVTTREAIISKNKCCVSNSIKCIMLLTRR